MASSRNRPPADPPAAVAAFLASHRFGPQRICVGLSGGVDSIVLLNALAELREAHAVSLSACHVHHGLSPHADHWVQHCEQACRALGVPLEVVRVVVEPDGAGLEAAAREARREVFARQRADWIALGHHADDQAETVLFRMLRGAGLRGVGGMRPIERHADGLALMRPLLALRRADILAWARSRGLSWVEDESNADTALSRNFLRAEVMPTLAVRFPAAVARMERAAAHFRESQDLLDQLAAADWRGLGGGEWLRTVALARLDDARIRNLVRWRIHTLGLRAPQEARLREALRQLAVVGREHPLCIALGDAELCHYRGQCWVQPASPAAPEEVALEVGCETAWGGGRVLLVPGRDGGLARSRLTGALTVGVRRAGDRLHLRPGGPGRSIKNLAQEAGVPPWMRERLPMLRLDGRVVWAAELGVAAEFAAAPGEPALVPEWTPAAGVVSRLPADP